MTDHSSPIAAEARLRAVFTPHAPVSKLDVFRGRLDQLRIATDAVAATGLHVVLFGDRGVGKTSLANVLGEVLSGVIAGTTRVNCSSTESFESVIVRALRQLRFDSSKQPLGFTSVPQPDSFTLDASLPPNFSPDDVAALLDAVPGLVVLIFDEFDRLPTSEALAMSDFIKALSDRGSNASVVIVGVATDIDDLVAAHESITRNLRQIQMPRMSADEIGLIVDQGMSAAGFEFESAAVRNAIVDIAQGYPHYAHLLCLDAGRAAADRGSSTVSRNDLAEGQRRAVQNADQSLRTAYFQAVTGTKKQNIWREVVLACATAESDERGFFSSRAVTEQLSRILGRDVIQQTVAFHLGKLTESSRGPLLFRVGPERRYRYNFVNPLLRPFIRLQAAHEPRTAD